MQNRTFALDTEDSTMARTHEATQHLREGHSLDDIAGIMGITVASVRSYLYTMVGYGSIRRSDILFAIPHEVRQKIEEYISEHESADSRDIEGFLDGIGHHANRVTIETYLSLRDSRVSRGDMYEFISDIERILHERIRLVLERQYGTDDSGWWLNGIPEDIRAECARTREKDRHQAAHPYCYTTFIQLKEIIICKARTTNNWMIFSSVLPAELGANRDEFSTKLTQLNDIRNRIMHPIKGLDCTEEEFLDVREFRRKIDPDRWRGAELG
jgi:predicted transcriptional regulator